MTTFNTGNPIGSTDSRDRLDNTENMDYLENSTTELTHADRLGTVRKTRHGMEAEHDAQISAHESEHDAQMQAFEGDFDGRLAGMAFTRVGSFTTGATLTDMRQVLVWEASQGGDGHEYGWAGTFPKVVAAGATPATSGGIGAGAWVDRTQETLRSEINVVVKRFDSVVDMITDLSLVVGQSVEWTSYHSGMNKGGNRGVVVAAGSGASDGGRFISIGNGLQVKGLFLDRQYTPERFGAYGDYDPVTLTGHNDYTALLTCFATGRCKLSANTNYKYAGTGTTPRLTTSLLLEGASQAAVVASQTSSIIYVTTPEVPFFMGGVPSVEFKNMAFICNKHAPATDNTSTTAADMQTCQFKMSGTHIRGNADATIPSDTHANTDYLLTRGATYVSSKTITDFSPYNTYNEVGSMHGRGLVLTKCLDAKLEGMVSGFGVGLVNWGSDLTNIEKCRISSNGINVYDKYLGAGNGGSYGTQLKVKNSEILYNFRAPCILLDGSRAVDIDDIYYEELSNAGVFIASQNANFMLKSSRIDDTWHRVAGTDQPFMLIDNYTDGNIIEDNAWFHFSSSVPKEVPNIRFINAQIGTLHKRQGFAIRKQRTTVFPKPDFSDASNSTYICTFDNDTLSPFMLTPTNVWSGVGVEHSPTVQNGLLTFYNPASVSKYFTGRLKLKSLSDSLTIYGKAQVLSGSSFYVSVKLMDSTGRVLAVIKDGQWSGGFNTTSFVTGALTLANLSSYPSASYIEIVWQTDTAYVVGFWL